ncbi:hypothetical protein Tco_0781452 [Tanacetum coccineum]
MKQRPRKPKRKDTKIPLSSVPVESIADEAVYEERDDSLERATTIATRLDAEQDRGGGPMRQDTMRDTIAQTRFENVSRFSNDPLLAGVNTPRSERKKKSRTHGLKRLYKVGVSARIVSSDDEATLDDQEDASKQGRKIHDIDADEDITMENVHDADMFRVHDLDGDEVFVETEEHMVNDAKTTSTIPVSATKDLFNVDMTLAQALAELNSTKPKAITTAATTTTTVVTRPKAKRLVIQEHDYEKGDELEQETSKKQKMKYDKETTELQSMIEVIPDKEEVAVDAIPLATKSPMIVD